jgi:hypothetical protein
MPTRISQIIAADGWFAVFAHPSGGSREHYSAGGQRTPARAIAGGPAPEFVPLVAWALVAGASTGEPDRVVGMVMAENRQPEVIAADDPSFLGYAGPGDPGIERGGFTPDWRAQARQRIGELKQGNGTSPITAR